MHGHLLGAAFIRSHMHDASTCRHVHSKMLPEAQEPVQLVFEMGRLHMQNIEMFNISGKGSGEDPFEVSRRNRGRAARQHSLIGKNLGLMHLLMDR